MRLIGVMSLLIFIWGCGPKEDATATSPDGRGTPMTSETRETTTEPNTGSLKVDFSKKLDFSEVGVPPYPNAQPVERGDAGIVDVPGDPLFFDGVIFATSDPPEKVLAFYKPHLKNATEARAFDASTLTGTNARGHTLSISITKGNGKTIATIMLVGEGFSGAIH